jgi:signal transduction histidine kinase
VSPADVRPAGRPLDRILDLELCGFLSFLEEGTLRLANAALYEMLGHEPGSLQGRGIEKILTIAARIFYQTHVFPLLKLKGRIDEIYLTLKTRDGDEILKAKAAAEEAARTRDEFLAVVSHERRTPLNAILGWAPLMRMSQGDPETAKQGLETIERNARPQARLIEDLLDVSRIVAGKLRIDVGDVDPSTVIEAALDVVRPAA